VKRATFATLLPVALMATAVRAADPAPARHAIEFRFTPTARTQIALWIEKLDGTFMGTVRLTQAVSYRGIGNRPGASQMNSGFRWPYGRRVDVLPVWAHRRAAATNAAQFKQVIFQHRTSEGCASNAGCGGPDSSVDAYYCLSFLADTTRQQALDAVSCASTFSSDKGRYIRADDVGSGYSEPIELQGAGMMRALDLTSLYPPRRDNDGACALKADCLDTSDALAYADDARKVMPDIDSVTMATPPQNQEQSVTFTIPEMWTDPSYVAWIEVNVEGDHNAAFSVENRPTPALPAGAWDGWAGGFGYPYRGQPSVVYRVPFTFGATTTFATATPKGYGDGDGFGPSGGTLYPMDARITDDPATMPGSGADRLRLIAPNDYRFQVNVRNLDVCQTAATPAVPTMVSATVTGDKKHSHQWGRLRFQVPTSTHPIDHYEVRYSKTAIVPTDATTFDRALPAMAAETDTVALMVPVTGAAGTAVSVDFGGMEPLTHYWIAIRAVDACNVSGPIAVAEVTSTNINFTQLSGCFIATAAYGSAMEPQVESLRVVRDALRPRSALFAAATDLYYRSAPAAAAVIARTETGRAVVRMLLGPVVDGATAVAPMVSRIDRARTR
jgi:hypothetical protein